MKKKGMPIIILALVVFCVPGVQAANIGLYDWAVHFDGITYEGSVGDTLPTVFDDTGFDWSTGLGSLNATISGAGSHKLIAFFDHEIDELINTFFNEYGKAYGTTGTGQSWEIDEPGYVYGDIYANVLGGALDNTNEVPSGSDDDVSMALAWDFLLSTDETAFISFNVSDVAPNLGFYLEQIDPDSQASIFFSSTMRVEGTPIPEPSTIFLIGTGLIGMVFACRKKWF